VRSFILQEKIRIRVHEIKSYVLEGKRNLVKFGNIEAIRNEKKVSVFGSSIYINVKKNFL
jgi:hypothetical protein